jgi:hypothetical protein
MFFIFAKFSLKRKFFRMEDTAPTTPKKPTVPVDSSRSGPSSPIDKDQKSYKTSEAVKNLNDTFDEVKESFEGLRNSTQHELSPVKAFIITQDIKMAFYIIVAIGILWIAFASFHTNLPGRVNSSFEYKNLPEAIYIGDFEDPYAIGDMAWRKLGEQIQKDKVIPDKYAHLKQIMDYLRAGLKPITEQKS